MGVVGLYTLNQHHIGDICSIASVLASHLKVLAMLVLFKLDSNASVSTKLGLHFSVFLKKSRR